jgi:hypothetical protein
MRGEHFVDVDTIKRETTKLLKELRKEDMQHLNLRLYLKIFMKLCMC